MRSSIFYNNTKKPLKPSGMSQSVAGKHGHLRRFRTDTVARAVKKKTTHFASFFSFIFHFLTFHFSCFFFWSLCSCFIVLLFHCFIVSFLRTLKKGKNRRQVLSKRRFSLWKIDVWGLGGQERQVTFSLKNYSLLASVSELNYR